MSMRKRTKFGISCLLFISSLVGIRIGIAAAASPSRIQLSRDFEERVAQLKARMKETQGFRLKVDPVLPVPDPAKDLLPSNVPRQ